MTDIKYDPAPKGQKQTIVSREQQMAMFAEIDRRKTGKKEESLTLQENEEYVRLRGIFSPTKDQLIRLNELRKKMGQKETGFFKMSQEEKDIAIQEVRKAEAKQKADYLKYRKITRQTPEQERFNRDPDF